MCGLGHKWGIYTGRHINFIREVFSVTPANRVTGPVTAQSGKQLRKWDGKVDMSVLINFCSIMNL